MAKYTIIIQERIPQKKTGFPYLANNSPDHYYEKRLVIETDKDIIAEVARLAAINSEYNEPERSK